MPTSVIGKSLNNGFAGTYAQQPDQIVIAAPNTGDAEMDFGDPVFSYVGGVAAAGSTELVPTMAAFKGVASAHIQSAVSYPNQNFGQYLAKDVVPVFERGGITVCVSNTANAAPAIDGPVYVRIANGTDAKPVGGFEAAADSTTYTATVTTQTSGSTALVISSVANLAVGMTVSGTGIPAGTIISAINTSTLTVTLSAAATSTASSGTVTFGGNTIQITNATWGCTADTNGVATLVIKTRNNS